MPEPARPSSSPLIGQLDAMKRRDTAVRNVIAEARYEDDNHGGSLSELRKALAELDAAQAECDAVGIRGRSYG